MEGPCMAHGKAPLRCVIVPCQSGGGKATCNWPKPFEFFRQACPPRQNFDEPIFNGKSLTCMPGSRGAIFVRVWQITFAFTGFMIVIKIHGYRSITAFQYFVTATVFQFIWSMILMMVDVYAVVADMCLHSCCLIYVFTVGDWITSMFTFSAACALAGITTLIDDDLNQCKSNHGDKYKAAAAMAFCAWIFSTISFVHSLKLQALRYASP